MELFLEYRSAMTVAESLHPTLLVRIECRDCQIPFLTATSNRGRPDIRCAFGCRQLHRDQESNRRSTEFNRSDAGRTAKKKRNRRRSLLGLGGVAPDLPRPVSTSAAHPLTVLERYYRRLIYLIDGILTNERELREILDTLFRPQAKKVRQQGPDRHDEARDNRDD